MSGLALTNQHTSVLFILPIALGVIYTESKTAEGVPFIQCIKWLCVPLSLYLYLPLSALFVSSRESLKLLFYTVIFRHDLDF